MMKLLSELYVNEKKINNRMVMAPLATWLSDETAEVNWKHLKHYHERKGPGLIIVEATTVSPEGRLASTQLGIFEDRHIKGLSKLAQTIKDDGGIPGIQIHHAGGKASLKTNYGLMPLVPSKNGVSENKECRELTIEEIKRIQDDFILGAERAVKAGFEYIEIHGAHGYLGTQFLSPITNKRTDEYGGSLENRQRFLLELFTAINENIAGKAIVSCRLGAAENNGLTLEEGIDTAKKLESSGMKMINISCANSLPDMADSINNDFSILMNIGAAIKKETSMTVIGVGGVKEPQVAEQILNEGLVDMIALGKAILADPGWAQKTIDNIEDIIERCRSCKRCLWFTEPEKCPVKVKLNK